MCIRLATSVQSILAHGHIDRRNSLPLLATVNILVRRVRAADSIHCKNIRYPRITAAKT